MQRGSISGLFWFFGPAALSLMLLGGLTLYNAHNKKVHASDTYQPKPAFQFLEDSETICKVVSEFQSMTQKGPMSRKLAESTRPVIFHILQTKTPEDLPNYCIDADKIEMVFDVVSPGEDEKSKTIRTAYQELTKSRLALLKRDTAKRAEYELVFGHARDIWKFNSKEIN